MYADHDPNHIKSSGVTNKALWVFHSKSESLFYFLLSGNFCIDSKNKESFLKEKIGNPNTQRQ